MRARAAISAAILLLATPPFPAEAQEHRGQLVTRLGGIRSRVMQLQHELVDGMKTQNAARDNLKKIKILLRLQTEERKLGQQRLKELERTIAELESRRGVLKERVAGHERSVRSF